MGWTAIGNGELLALASQEFAVFLTVDRNLAFQQNVGTLTIAVIVRHEACQPGPVTGGTSGAVPPRSGRLGVRIHAGLDCL
jgi:hypothetical protein